MKQTNANSFDSRSAGEGAMDQPLFGESRPRVSRIHVVVEALPLSLMWAMYGLDSLPTGNSEGS